MNRVNNYLMQPIYGILGKMGINLNTRPSIGLPFLLHNFSRGNAVTRRTAGYLPTNSIRYHKSRSMGGF